MDTHWWQPADDAHELQGPHLRPGDLVESVAPLRLLVLPQGRVVELGKPAVLVGRHTDADLRLAYPEVSRRHCRLVFEDGLWHVHDLDSLNGIFVNGERMHAATLYEGDRIRLGEVTLLVTAAPAPEMLRSIADALTGQ